MDILKYKSYKKFLADLILLHKSEKGFQNKLAQSAGCQRSYLSQVLNREIHLTLDQAYNLITSLNYTDLECEYFINLVSLERSGSNKLKKHLEDKLQKIQSKSLRLSSLISSSEFSPEELNKMQEVYYSHWTYAAIHIASFIPQNQTVRDFAQFLNIKEDLVLKTLTQLQNMKLMTKKGEVWMATNNNLTIKDDSLYIKNHHMNWRLKAIENIPNYDHNEDLHYSSVLVVSEKDTQEIKKTLNNLIVKIRKQSLPSEPEVLINFNIDFYRV